MMVEAQVTTEQGVRIGILASVSEDEDLNWVIGQITLTPDSFDYENLDDDLRHEIDEAVYTAASELVDEFPDYDDMDDAWLDSSYEDRFDLDN